MELVERRLFSSRSAAHRAIEEGRVLVRGVAAQRPSMHVDDDAELVVIPGEDHVSRSGAKLAAALSAFEIDVRGRRAADLGSSTGGFTDCLLRRGAASVLAVDVGTDQLDPRLRSDPRVTVAERTDVRRLDATPAGGPFDVVVVDLSFISLRLVASHIARLGGPDTDFVVLVKPQYEVGREALGRDGVVRSDDLRQRALRAVTAAFAEVGLRARATIESPIQGKAGNREFLLWLRAGLAHVTGVDQDGRHG